MWRIEREWGILKEAGFERNPYLLGWCKIDHRGNKLFVSDRKIQKRAATGWPMPAHWEILEET